MAKLPTTQDPNVAAIDAWHEAQEDAPRYHLGCSIIGHDCDRWIWLAFRWAVKEQFDGRKLRLFRRGKLEEATVLADLRAIGMEIVAEQDGHQLRVSWGGHLSGSLDGLILQGVKQAPTAQHVLEIKTHNSKSFSDLEKDGVQKSKPQHWAQMQVYMRGRRVDRALYVAVCKDDDRLYFERVRLDKEAADYFIERGRRLSLDERMPEPCANGSPTWYKCKWCPAYSMCWEAKPASEANCRTCCHSTPLPDGTWNCERWAGKIPNEHQPKGCRSHVMHPDLWPWPLIAEHGEWTGTWQTPAGNLWNGEDGLSTQELLAAVDAADCPF